jgi:hypothetical protein
MALIEIDWKPGKAQLRVFSRVFLGFALFWAGLLYLFKEPSVLTLQIILGAGVLIALLGQVVPVVIRPLYQFMMAVTLPIGLVVSSLLMGLIYFVVLTPIGLLVRMFGRDPMNRKLDADAVSYWIERTPQRSVRQYFKQY